MNEKKIIRERIGNVDASNYFLDPTKDYRTPLRQFKVNKHGDLLIKRNQTKTNDGWEILIPRSRLNEDDWISHMKEKANLNFGEFVAAYMKTCELANIRTLEIQLYGFDEQYKFADE